MNKRVYMHKLTNAANLSNFNTVWLDELLYGRLHQLWQVVIDFVHADIIQPVEAAETHVSCHASKDFFTPWCNNPAYLCRFMSG